MIEDTKSQSSLQRKRMTLRQWKEMDRMEWQISDFSIFAASLTGTLVGIIVMLQKGKNLKFAIPFGPFLSIGAMSYVFFGEKVMYWYLHSF